MPKVSPARRDFLKQSAGLALAALVPPGFSGSVEQSLPNPVGYATIAWPQSEFDEALKTISSLGFKGVQMLGWVREAYLGPRAEALREHLRRLELEPVTLSCSDVKLDPESSKDETSEVQSYATFFQRLGGHFLQVTDGGQPDRKYPAETIRALAARVNAMGKLAQDFALTLGYHPHFGTMGETREGLGRVLDSTDPRYVKLIADVGHLTLGGCDPAEVVRSYRERLICTHFKDVRRDVAELARKSRSLVRDKEYFFCEIGTGAVHFPAIMQAFGETQYRGWVILELDAYRPGPGGPAGSARRNKQGAQKLGLRV